MSIQELEELANDISYSFENTITLENRPPLRFPHRTASLDLLEVCELYEDVEFEEEKVEGNWIIDLLTLDDLKNIHQDYLDIPDQKVDQNQLKSLLVHYNPNLDWPDDEFMLVFLKMDGDFDGYCDWADFIAYLLYEFHSKESLATTDLHQLELPINENPIVLPSKHRHPIISVLFRPYVYKDRTWDFDNGKYITISTDGAMNIWTLDFELEKSQYAYYPKEAKVQKTFVTSVVILADCNIICMATRERDLRFYDISLGNFYLRTQIVGLHQTITALNYYFYTDCEKSSLLIGGDFVGNILYFKFKPKNGGPFRTLSQNTRSGFFQIKRMSLENGQIPGLKFRMFEGFQSDWIHQIEWYPSHKTILSCQNRTKNSLISLDPSSKGIRVRFNIPKGVNVFCVVNDVEPNLFVTGGYDRAIRVWNHSDSFEPLAVLKGHRSPIAAIVVQNKGARIYSLSVDKVFKVWDPKQKTCIMTVSGKLSDLESEVPFTCFYNPVYRRFIAANTKIFLLRLGHAVNLYYTEGYTHVAGVTKALFNPIFKCVVTVGMDSNILTWDPYNGKRTHMIKNAHTKKQYGETLTVGITSATFGPSWIHLLTGAVDGSVKMWNFTLGICLREMMMEQDCCVTGLYWIPQRLLAMGWNKHVTEWVDEVEIGDSKHWPTYHTEDITASAICTPDVIATGTYSGELIFLKLKNGQPFKIHFVGSPNLDNKIGFALNRGYPLKLTASTEKKIGQTVPCYCTEEKPCDCTWKCRCLENCDCLITNRCKCDQTIFFMKEAKEMEDMESMFDGVFGKNEKEVVQRSKSAKSHEEKKKKKKTQPMFGRIAGRMEIHAMYFLQTRDDLVKTGSLLTSLQNGWIQLWSRNVDGGLVSSFYAIHVVGDYVTAMTSNSDDSFLFTGHAFGYVKIWQISNFGRDGPPIKKCMPILRLMFPFLINDKIPGRAKRAARGQVEPMILSSCRNHVSKVSHIELIEGNEIYITCGLDKAVRFWSYGGQYIGTLGSVLPWPKILPNIPFKPWPLRIPPDLKRVVSSTSLKVLTDCWAEEKKVEQKSNKSDLFSSDEDDEKRYKRQIEASELTHKIYPDCLKEPVLGKYFKLTEINVTVKQPPKLNLQDPVLRVLNLMKTTEVEVIPKPKTPPFASREDCEKLKLEKLKENMIVVRKGKKIRQRGRSRMKCFGRDFTRKTILTRMRSRSKRRSRSKKRPKPISCVRKRSTSSKRSTRSFRWSSPFRKRTSSKYRSRSKKRSKSPWSKFLIKKQPPVQTPSMLELKRDQRRIYKIVKQEIEKHRKKKPEIEYLPPVIVEDQPKKVVKAAVKKSKPKGRKGVKFTTDTKFKMEKLLKRPAKTEEVAKLSRLKFFLPKSRTRPKTKDGHSSSDETPSIVKKIRETPKTKMRDFHLDIHDVEEILDYLENDNFVEVYDDY